MKVLNPTVIGSGGGGGGVDFDVGVNNGDLVKRNGSNLAKVEYIPESLIRTQHALVSFSNNAGTREIGSILNSFTLSWEYNRNTNNPISQSLSHGIGAIPVANRSYNVVGAGLNTTRTYTLSAVGDDGTILSLNTTINFQLRRYYGISESILATDADVLATLTGEFATSRLTTKTFDATLGLPPNYLYYCYPSSWGLPSNTIFNGFGFSDYNVIEIVNFTNSSGHTESYYLIRTNSKYNTSSLIWQVL